MVVWKIVNLNSSIIWNGSCRDNVNADREDMKRKNRGTVLKLIATGRCSSRIELSKAMGVTKTAISKMVTELMESGFLIETRKQENAELGRNPIGLNIAETAPLVIGVLIMRDYCEAVLCNMKLEILQHKKVYQNWTDKEELMETVYSLVDQMLYGAEMDAESVLRRLDHWM